MNAVDIIMKQRDRQELNRAEIEFLVRGISDGSIPDYQVSAWAMAVFLNGMSPRETADLTLAMAGSGEMIDLSAVPGIKIDKHSTGGVGDKTTLITVPIVAAAGVPVVKMSGRGLGHTGGTIDKLESIPGFRTGLLPQDLITQARRIGAVIAAQSGNLVPADKRLYALRDVTATVDSLPLIASSIMSKKIAAGADRILLDVKAGSGAFMKNRTEARELARVMMAIGRQTGRRVASIVTNMETPLGCMIGNSLEVRESIDVLRGMSGGPLRELCLELAAAMLWLGEAAPDLDKARGLGESLLDSGRALEKFLQIVEAQGGLLRLEDDNYGLPASSCQKSLVAAGSGFLQGWDAYRIGLAAVALGAGRRRKEDPLDYGAGIELLEPPGTFIKQGSPVAVLHASEHQRLDEAAALLENALALAPEALEKPPLILERLLD